MGDKVDFSIRTPSLGHAFREAINFVDSFLDLSQVAWLVIGLKRKMVSVEVTVAVDSAC